MSTHELKTKLEEYREYKAMLNELQDALGAIEDEIKAYMGDSEEISVEGVKVRYKRYQQSRIDSKRLKAEQADIYEQYSKIVEGRRFSIA